MTHVAVIDIGKTNAKLALVDLNSLTELAVLTRPNRVMPGPPYPHFDVEGHWAFLLEGLARFHRDHGVNAISITTHGASAVLLDQKGGLAAPVLDYEHTGPNETADSYDAIRPDFSETGSPRLPMGLNVGAQLHWMLQTDPDLDARIATVVTYPQYWGFRLTGALASDVSSLGCHTDLWNPGEGRFSSLVAKLGLEGRIAPARPSADKLGHILSEIAAGTGLPPETPVHCGIHDSNASLLPHVLGRKAPFSVVSTGTWVIVMAVGAGKVALDPARDTLINVNGLGDPVPSARVMGGREYEVILSGQQAPATPEAVADILENGTMLLPAVVRESGPFQGREASWIGQEPALGSPQRTVAASFYLALMTATCLELIGHQGEVIVEGPFARNAEYCQMLAAASGQHVVTSESATGTSQGAALLAAESKVVPSDAGASRFAPGSKPMALYAKAWTSML
ncbi:FGGY-family carbohydrate kinase [Primorskyibacter sp. 2E233]|uniref:FGGY-family carbohydrate kinase n=1 Tax=Primorskyibacter sp. 2E233 TaxID=3413431 RepID=UPI003BEF7B1A